MILSPASALAGLPQALRDQLFEEYKQIVVNFAEHRWAPAELSGGRFAEVAYSVLDGYFAGTFPTTAAKPPNMVAACRALEQKTSGPRSFRILIPRWLPALYEVRNNRNVGHVGSDVDPSQMDASVVLSVSSWTMAEFVRVFHAMAPADAQRVVDALVERRTPLIWEVEGKLRVLNTALPIRDQVLLLLYSKAAGTSVANLLAWTEYKNSSRFRENVLAELHGARLLEFDRQKDVCSLSPMGSLEVEDRVLK